MKPRIAELYDLRLVDDVWTYASAPSPCAGKGGKERIVPFPKPTAKALNEWMTAREQRFFGPEPKVDEASAVAPLFSGAEGATSSPRSVRRRLRKVVQRAGLAGRIHPHRLRHSLPPICSRAARLAPSRSCSDMPA